MSEEAKALQWVPSQLSGDELTRARVLAVKHANTIRTEQVSLECWALSIAISAEGMCGLPDEHDMDPGVRRFLADRFAAVADALRESVH